MTHCARCRADAVGYIGETRDRRTNRYAPTLCQREPEPRRRRGQIPACFRPNYRPSKPAPRCSRGFWPPKGIEVLSPWKLPLLNTLILLTSGATLTWGHHGLLHGDRDQLKKGLIATIALGALFTAIQAWEYVHAPFAFKFDPAHPAATNYGSTFFMATGFHGFHVIIGTLFLAVCLIRTLKGHFKPDQHLGLEFAAWYWHFVDVVWLFLFSAIYVWGNWGGMVE